MAPRKTLVWCGHEVKVWEKSIQIDGRNIFLRRPVTKDLAGWFETVFEIAYSLGKRDRSREVAELLQTIIHPDPENVI